MNCGNLQYCRIKQNYIQGCTNFLGTRSSFCPYLRDCPRCALFTQCSCHLELSPTWTHNSPDHCLLAASSNYRDLSVRLKGTTQNLRGRPRGLRGRPRGLRGRPRGLRGRPRGLRGRPRSLRGQPRMYNCIYFIPCSLTQSLRQYFAVLKGRSLCVAPLPILKIQTSFSSLFSWKV